MVASIVGNEGKLLLIPVVGWKLWARAQGNEMSAEPREGWVKELARGSSNHM